MRRTFGWIQDGGSFENLKKVLMAITAGSKYNLYLRNTLIPKYIPNRFGQAELLSAINEENYTSIPYDLIKGKGSSCQLTVAENMNMFGYSKEEATRIVSKGGRGNAACTGIAQIATPAQKRLPNGLNKPYQGDWSADSFGRWGISLGFIDYDMHNDTCCISELGHKFALSETGSEEETNLIGEALLSYPPACRVLQLLSEQGHLTKFEIGKQLGFIGEAGFTSMPQALYVGGISTAHSAKEITDIRQNFEGSSDKYARMIAGWLSQIGWVAKVKKEVTEKYLGLECTAEIAQSYMITQKGRSILNRIIGGSSHKRTPKIVFWNMLATAALDSEYLRNRRYHILQAIKTPKNLEEIQIILKEKGFEDGIETIRDDLKNFTCIGLEISEANGKYQLKDDLKKLEIPYDIKTIERSNISIVKENIREKLKNVDHRYLVLLDLAYDSQANREFEIETMSLLTDEMDYEGLHLGGSRKPDGLFYKDENGVIVDTKAYSDGYNLPIPQADEMIRYIDENKTRGDINPNCWWENFGKSTKVFSYLFVSSEFKGHFQENIQYIKNRTDYDGGVITAENLLLFAENIKSGKYSYDDSFRLIRTNEEIRVS